MTVKKGTSGNTAATVKIDYTIDADRGRIYIDPKGGIADGKIRVSYTPVAASRKQVKTGDLREIRAAVRYIEDTDTGKGRNYYAATLFGRRRRRDSADEPRHRAADPARL